MWLVTADSITECASSSEAFALLAEVLTLRRSAGWDVWPAVRTVDSVIHLLTRDSGPGVTAKSEHVFVTSVRPAGVIRDGAPYEV